MNQRCRRHGSTSGTGVATTRPSTPTHPQPMNRTHRAGSPPEPSGPLRARERPRHRRTRRVRARSRRMRTPRFPYTKSYMCSTTVSTRNPYFIWVSQHWSARDADLHTGVGASTPSSNLRYSSPVSSQSSNWMTPISSKRRRSHLSLRSSRPSFLQFGTILENSIDWNT